MKKGRPVGEPSTPRAFALAPGGDSGAVPTTMAFKRGQKWPVQTSAQINFARLRNIQWRPVVQNISDTAKVGAAVDRFPANLGVDLKK